MEALQRSIQEKSGEARQLQRQLADLERDRHTEVVKLRLEASSWPGGSDHKAMKSHCSVLIV